MTFSPYVILSATGETVSVAIEPATQVDLEATHHEPKWQTDWTGDYLSNPAFDKFALKSFGGELIALAAYRIVGNSAFVYIIYAESAPHSNPTLTSKALRKYSGIGRLLISYGIKYSVDHGCRGDVVFEAKTDELARHYEEDFGAKRVASTSSGGPKRYMLADQDAWRLFSSYLTKEGE